MELSKNALNGPLGEEKSGVVLVVERVKQDRWRERTPRTLLVEDYTGSTALVSTELCTSVEKLSTPSDLHELCPQHRTQVCTTGLEPFRDIYGSIVIIWATSCQKAGNTPEPRGTPR